MIVAGLIGGIVFFLLGWLVWGILLMDMMSGYSNAACMKPEAEMNMAFLIIANLLWGSAFAYILSNWSGQINFSKGATAGAIISIIIGVAYDLYSLAMTTMMTSTTPVLINIGANLVVGGIAGGIIGWYLGRGAGGTRSARQEA